MAERIRSDYVIAGAGIAGILLAKQLAASGKKVVLLDQGPRYSGADRARMVTRSRRQLNDFADYNDDAEPGVVTPHTSAREAGSVAAWNNLRMFGIGGTALHFEGIMIRPRPEDLQVRSRFGYGRDWPLSYAELEPWLTRAEVEIGVAGKSDNPYAAPRGAPYPMEAHPSSHFDKKIFAPALKKLGMAGHACPRATASRHYRGRSACRACRACRFCPTGARYSPDLVHLPSLEARENFTLLEKTSLRRLETARDGGKIVAAHALRIDDRQEIVLLAKHFILALGGIATPRMLMLSAGSGHRSGLGNGGGMLGRGFSDHFNLFATFDVGRHAGYRLGFETMICEHGRVKVDRRQQPSSMLFPSPSMDWFPVGSEATDWALAGDRLDLAALRQSVPRMASVLAMTELSGLGRIELDPGNVDAYGDPVAKVTMKLSDWDRRSVDAFRQLVPDLAAAMGAQNVSEVYPDLGMGYHPCGATAMAKSLDQGVCDSNLRVFGLDNLYLAGNSVFPHMGANPPTLTIAALALRLAAHLQGGG